MAIDIQEIALFIFLLFDYFLFCKNCIFYLMLSSLLNLRNIILLYIIK